MNGKNKKDIMNLDVASSCLKHSIEGDFNTISVSGVEKWWKRTCTEIANQTRSFLYIIT